MSCGYLGLLLDPRGPLIEVTSLNPQISRTIGHGSMSSKAQVIAGLSQGVSTTDGDVDASIYVIAGEDPTRRS